MRQRRAWAMGSRSLMRRCLVQLSRTNLGVACHVVPDELGNLVNRSLGVQPHGPEVIRDAAEVAAVIAGVPARHVGEPEFRLQGQPPWSVVGNGAGPVVTQDLHAAPFVERGRGSRRKRVRATGRGRVSAKARLQDRPRPSVRAQAAGAAGSLLAPERFQGRGRSRPARRQSRHGPRGAWRGCGARWPASARWRQSLPCRGLPPRAGQVAAPGGATGRGCSSCVDIGRAEAPPRR